MLAIADVAEVTQILNRRSALELGGPKFLFNVPMRTTIRGRIKEGTLQGRHRPVNGTLAPARHPGKGIFGRGTKGGTSRR
jgi:hypothetical protein